MENLYKLLAIAFLTLSLWSNDVPDVLRLESDIQKRLRALTDADGQTLIRRNGITLLPALRTYRELLTTRDAYSRFMNEMEKLSGHDKRIMDLFRSVYAASGGTELPPLCTRLPELDDYTKRRIPGGVRDYMKYMSLAQYLAVIAVNRLHYEGDRSVHYVRLEVPILAYYNLLDRSNNTFKPKVRARAQKNLEVLTILGHLLPLEGQ